ncbi:unnamed protein product, partial [Brenthis ino]
MAKFAVILAALAAVAHSSAMPVLKVDEDSSSFSYDVADPISGDYKSQVESRIGGVVRGQYSLVEPDGTQRIVDYTADDVNGFNAVVRKEPLALATKTVVASTPTVVAASPSVVAVTPSVVAARNLILPNVYSASSPLLAKTYAVPSVYSVSPSVYSSGAYAHSFASPVYSSYGYPGISYNYV